MKNILFFLFLSPILCYSQINSSGYSIFKWGVSKSTIPVLGNCSQINAGSDFVNCELRSKDSIFYDKFHFDYCNYRFYKNQFSEINFDLRYKELPFIVSKLSVDFGTPRVIENTSWAADTSNVVIGYEWIISDTRIFIINKGATNPVWCNVSSQKIRKTYKKTIIDIEKLIFN